MKRILLSIMLSAVLGGAPAKADFLRGVQAYDNGDKLTAVREIGKAARAGQSQAQHMLAWFFDTGWGVSRNPAKAIHWYRLAARQGDRISQLILGEKYANGGGVARDPVAAYMWFARAARQGDRQAARHMAKLARAMTKSQLARARKRASVPRSGRMP
jgi:TPR repeat protein